MGAGAVEFPLLHVLGLLFVLSPLPHTQCIQLGFEAGRCDTMPSPQVSCSSLPSSMSCPGQDWPGLDPSSKGALIVQGRPREEQALTQVHLEKPGQGQEFLGVS